MNIATLNESPSESRVAITPNVVKLYINLGLDVMCETQAGMNAGFTDENYKLAGCKLAKRKELLQETAILLTINEPSLELVNKLPAHLLLIAPVDKTSDIIQVCCKRSIDLLSTNLIPRISRAQSMDILSSQANLAGYCAVLEGIHHFNRAIPMMMTAAGMIQPAKILVLGAGVAGLQAIATAKRLGAVVYAFDVRRAAKEQVESLGAKFIEVAEQDNENNDGYAKETSPQYKELQAKLIDEYAAQADIIVTTALVPGRPAPRLLMQSTVEKMKENSVIVDLATTRGGNCELSKQDQIINHQGVTIIGYSNFSSLVPATASELYANNLLALIKRLVIDSKLNFNFDDEIIKQSLLCYQGNYLATPLEV